MFEPVSPVPLASAVFEDLTGIEVSLDGEVRGFSAGSERPFGILPPLEVSVEWKARSNLLFVDSVLSCNIGHIKRPHRTHQELTEGLEPYLLKDGQRGQIVFLKYANRETYPGYEMVLDCSPLDDDELKQALRAMFLRTMRVHMLLCPLFQMLEAGTYPTLADERLQVLNRSYGYCAVRNFGLVGNETSYMELPEGLYGGIRHIRAQ